MVDDEEEWRSKQKSNEDTSGKGSYCEADCMDIDNEDRRGCYVRDISIMGVKEERVWIRAEYMRIYDHCNERYQVVALLDEQAPSVVITSQSDIGKARVSFCQP